ncbi:MAG TPA: M56 family metallopeptidase [Terriglobia bacterium]|nr:M56 family metallopeptidase [Terriglobia bacterium]
MISAVTNHLWQSTLFAIGVGLLTLAFRKNRAQVRYWLWFSASLKFLIPFSLLLNLGGFLWRSPAAKGLEVPAVTYTIVRMAEPFPQSPTLVPSEATHRGWLPIVLVGIWACGLGCIALIRLRGWLRIRAAVRASIPVDMTFPVEVRCTPAALEPGIVGFFRPMLLFPAGIVDRLAPNQLQTVLAHELCHLRRCDNVTAAIHMVVEAVFWFHPLTWWISSRLMAERERACDEGVLESGAEPQAYAETILKTCQFYLESPLTCVPGVTGADLKKRIVSIMTGGLPHILDFPKKLLLCAAGFAAVAVPVLFGAINRTEIEAGSQAQNTGASAPVFEVASIKPNKSGGGFAVGGGKAMFEKEIPGWSSPDRFSARGETLLTLIQMAYGIHQAKQISRGPNWIDSEEYDVEAKVDKSEADTLQKLSPDHRKIEQQRLLQALLADRCKMRVHRGTELLPVYALVIAKNGPKLRQAKPDDTYSKGIQDLEGRPAGAETLEFGAGQLTGQAVPIALLAQELMDQPELGGRLVLDQTGLTGTYDFKLQWTPERPTSNSSQEPDAALPPDSSGPSLFTALQRQLGLRLESAKGPVDTVVIDHFERPSEN